MLTVADRNMLLFIKCSLSLPHITFSMTFEISGTPTWREARDQNRSNTPHTGSINLQTNNKHSFLTGKSVSSSTRGRDCFRRHETDERRITGAFKPVVLGM